MIERPAAQVATVVANQGRVVVLHTGVDIGRDGAGAGHAVGCPHVVGVDLRHTPLDDLRSYTGIFHDRIRFFQLECRQNGVNLRHRRQVDDRRLIGAQRDQVDDPKRLGITCLPGSFGDLDARHHVGLCAFGS